MQESTNLIPNLVEEADLRENEDRELVAIKVRQDLEFFQGKMEDFTHTLRDTILNEDLKFSDRIDSLLEMNVSLVPILLAELAPHKIIVNNARSDQAVKVLNVVKGLEASLYKKRETEAREEVDLNHPKFQKAMDWMMEGVLASMTEMGIDDQMKASFIHNFANRMVGFEDESNKKLRGTAFQNLDTLDNPLVSEFNDKRQG